MLNTDSLIGVSFVAMCVFNSRTMRDLPGLFYLPWSFIAHANMDVFTGSWVHIHQSCFIRGPTVIYLFCHFVLHKLMQVDL